jgi:Spy/CpxP family protein refolding chaperone
MKKVRTSIPTAVAAVLLCSVSMFGQATPPSSQSGQGAEAQPTSINDKDVEMLRANLRANRKELMARNMDLTADEATKFWPIFDQYRKEAIKPNDERWALLKEYAANYSTMTDAQAQDYIKRAIAVDQQLLAVRQKYVPVFEKVISAKKTALWYQIDRHIDLMINLQLSSMIPLVDTTK